MPRSQILLFSAVILIIIILGTVLWFPSTPALSLTRIITLTQDGFSPAKLVITEGDTVTFASTLEKPFWPASDLHPTHSVYSEFDPRKPISATSTWSFTFNKAGTWGFHDHLISKYVGKIIVLTKEGDVVTEDCRVNEESAKCHEKEITNTLKTKGLDAAFERMSELYETSSLFRETCHSNAHILGDAAYDLFKKGKMSGLSPKTSYCGYGFYHGFMEKMIQTTGSLEEAHTFCKKAGELLAKETSDAEGACYHGIGHGTLDGNDPSLWNKPAEMVGRALDLCSKVSPNDVLLTRCSSGVFNSAAILSHDPKYGIVISKENPYLYCLQFSGTFFSKTCYEEMNTIAEPDGTKFPASMKLIEQIKSREDAKNAMLSLASYHAKFHVDSSYFDTFSGYCLSLRSDLISPCVTGFVGGLIEFGSPGKEHELALNYCGLASFSTELKKDCYGRLNWLVRHIPKADLEAKICGKMEEQYRSIICK